MENSANQIPHYKQRRCEVGAQLRAARELKQQTVAQVATSLRATRSLIERLETGRWEQIGPGTYGRGFARGYARLMQVELGNLDDCLEPALEDDVDVQAASLARRRRQSALRVQRLAAYSAATALIGVPLVFLLATAFRGELWSVQPAAGVSAPQPILASLVPSSRADNGLVLRAAEATEVTVTDDNGTSVWHGLIEANGSRQFDTHQGLLVRFENPEAISATLHGKRLALAPYRVHQAVELRIPANQ